MNIKQKFGCLVFLVFFALVSFYGFKYYKKRHTPPPVVIEPREEINITIIPGWNLRQIAVDWTEKGVIENEQALYDRLGYPAKDYSGQKAPRLFWTAGEFSLLDEMPDNATFEGYLIPDTYRIYKDSSLQEVLTKIFNNLEEEITPEMRAEIKKQGKTFYEILTMASVVEKEAPDKENMAMVADIFWRRNEIGMALQSCATVNYITGKNTPGVSAEDTEIDSLYNTYKYPGLPPGPIAVPSLTAIEATIYPKANNYYYFMSGTDGVIHYARTLDEHNLNVWKYLR